jgi:hypothetical protein
MKGMHFARMANAVVFDEKIAKKDCRKWQVHLNVGNLSRCHFNFGLGIV